MSFPQLGNIDKRIFDTIQQKASSNVRASQAMPWIRVTSCLDNFLTMESSQQNDSFATRYGDTGKSGRIGIEYPGGQAKSKYAEDDSRGLRPSPIINSVSISQGNEGLSKKSSFTIICYSSGQATEILKYFLEPGNMVLVEWGENTNISYKEKAAINKCAIVAYNNLRHIQQKRTNAHGMYDAVLGTITGGGMTYGDNETFEVNVELTAIGEIPAYLQHHKGITNGKSNIQSGKSYQQHELDNEDLPVGKALFMQMFNDLPSHKRISTLKNEGDKTDSWMLDASNFLNMDKETIDDLRKQMSGGAQLNSENKEDGDPIVIESDVPLFSEKRYIRCALAFHILDLQDNVATDAIQIGDCPGQSKSQGTVQWYNTICRAHKNMFSTNSDYLYIPNKNAPMFDVIGALSKKTKLSNVLPPLTAANVVQSSITEGPNGEVKYELAPKSKKGEVLIKDLHPQTYEPNLTESHYFPCTKPLNFDDQACFDNTYGNQVADAHEWGFLRDLYINFDFFCDTMNKNGLVTKDVYYDLLNGLSAATNLYWNFQIVVRGHTKIYSPGGPTDSDPYYNWKNTPINNPGPEGQEELQIIDASFGGRMTEANGVGLAGFQSRGTLSPFLSCELNFEMTGPMKSQATARKLANAPKNPNAEDKEVDFKGLFSDKPDTVLDALNSVQLKMTADAKIAAEKEAKEKFDNRSFWEKTKDAASSVATDVAETFGQDTPEEAAEAKAMKSNYEFFANNALVIPKPQDRDADMDVVDNLGFDGLDTVSLDEIVLVGVWADSNVLKKLQQLNEGTCNIDGLLSESSGTTSTLNVPLLPIKFNFTIHGVSGIRVGDTFSIVDLPTKYKNKVFQVVQVAHSIEQNLWSTKIEGQLRNLVRGSGPLKENTKHTTQEKADESNNLSK